MNPAPVVGRESAFRTLRRFARGRSEQEQCEFCSLVLAPSHRHLLEVATRKVVCVCDPCALRFESALGKWKLIPRDARALPGFQMSDAQWQSLGLPINLAFMFYSTPVQNVRALYPSPAGATESLVSLESWQALQGANPALKRLEPDVEALLVKRLGEPYEYYSAPMDLCFELVGRIRLHWRGFTGGDKVWQEIESFFARLRERAPVVAPPQPEASRG